MQSRAEHCISYEFNVKQLLRVIQGHSLGDHRKAVEVSVYPVCTGRAKKSNPLAKILYLWNCS